MQRFLASTLLIRYINWALVLGALCFVPKSAYSQAEEYILKPGDVISVSVVEHPEFSGRHKIRPDGRINYPVIGELDVASLSCAQLVKIMQGKLASYVNNPVVSVSIEAYYSNRVYIIGAVGRTGEFEIYEPIDVMKAIILAGGLTNTKVKSIKIIRADGNVVQIPMVGFWGTESRRDNKRWVLYPGDTLYVPTSFSIPWAMISTVLGVISVSLGLYLTIMSLGSR